MELNVFERLIVLNILPKEGSFTDLKVLDELKKSLSFSNEEHEALQFEQEGGNVKWRNEGDVPKEIEIGSRAKVIIEDVLKELDKDKKLKEEHLSLYEKFVGGE